MAGRVHHRKGHSVVVGRHTADHTGTVHWGPVVGIHPDDRLAVGDIRLHAAGIPCHLRALGSLVVVLPCLCGLENV